MKDLKKLCIPQRVWLVAAAVLLAAECAHFPHARAQFEYLAEAGAIGLFFALLLPWFFPKRKRGVLTVTAALVTAAAVLLPCVGSLFYSRMVRWERETLAAPETERRELFAGKNVLVLVPHEDDELLLCGGVIEEYVAADSRVTLAFATNGDHFGDGERRLREALHSAETLGISAENVIFLGFGDGWQTDDGTVLFTDADGLTTYDGAELIHALPEHPALREGERYSRESYKESLRELLTRTRPDTVFCVDAEAQYEHRTLSVLFDEVMGELLAEDTAWRPTVYKGYTYLSGWATGETFAPGKLSSTVLTGETVEENVQCRISDAVRYPVGASAVTLFAPQETSIGRALRCHASQDAVLRAGSLVRADRLFFPRRTDSLLYDAAVTPGAEALHDFVISAPADATELLSEYMRGGVYSLEENKTVTFSLTTPTAVGSVVLYDDPAAENRILSGELLFSDGTRQPFGELPNNGSAAVLTLPRAVTTGEVTVRVTGWDGVPGLTEVEAFAPETERTFPFAKLTDENGDFLYTALLPEEGNAVWSIYASGSPTDGMTVRAEGVEAEMQNGTVIVRAESGASGTVTLLSADGETLDTARVLCPKPFLRKCVSLTDESATVRIGEQWQYYRALWHKLVRHSEV